MNDKALLLFALTVAIAGLCLLLLVKPSEDEAFVLRGVVVEDRGSRSVVAANITLVAKDVKKGDEVSLPVFWSGEGFVAVPAEKR